jgi:GAF domain-containing protein
VIATEIVSENIVSENNDKPVFDEQTLAKVLEAAYLLQEHNRELLELEVRAERRAYPAGLEPAAPAIQTPGSTAKEITPKDDYTAVLAQIVETQHQIQVRHLDLAHAVSLIAERVLEMTRATGAGIGILEGRNIRYRAAAGVMALPVGAEVRVEKALCSACVRVGDVIRCADVNVEFLIDAEECRRRGIQSLIAVPIYHGGKTAGGLEVYYPNTNAFTEPDVHTCQLMAGLVTEALARNDELAWKTSLATERAVMLEALEKLKPNLAALADTTAAAQSVSREGAGPVSAAPTDICGKCGHELMGDEQFCGECGLPRSGDYGRPSMQSKVASMMQMQEAAKKDAAVPISSSFAIEPSAPAIRRSETFMADSAEQELPELFQLDDAPMEEAAEDVESADAVEIQQTASITEPDLIHSLQTQDDEEMQTPAETALAKVENRAHWSSAAAARAFLEQLARGKRSGAVKRFLTARRGDFYLALALILVASVIRWGIWSSHSVSATGSGTAAAAHHKPSPNADLSLFDRMLIQLGLAEAPEPVEDKGNPNTEVWVDLQTALYYCPGADLYGKTPKGRYSTQRDAQLDQFEPAYRKACN